MKRVLAPGLLALAASAAFLAPNASAATEFGNRCTGDSAAPGTYTLTTLAAPGPLPLTAPSAGVITRVTTLLTTGEALPFAIPAAVKLLRPTGTPNGFTVVGEQKIGVAAGSNTYAARIPVAAGDRLGIAGEPFVYAEGPVPGVAFYCKDIPGTVLGAAESNVALNTSATFDDVVEGAVPLVAAIEPDADNDGHGDETQDQCPQSATTQLPCPVITLDALSQLGKRSATVVVTVGTSAPVAVSATVKLAKGKVAKLRAGAKTVTPGRFGSFKLKFPQALRERLKELPPKQKLTLKVTASATNVAGAVSTDKLSAKLKGQAKPPKQKPAPQG